MHFILNFLAATLPLAVLAAPNIEYRQTASKINVDLTKKYQTMDGFGFSLAFQRANLVVNLPAAKQKAVLDLLFSTTNGTGFTILRNGLGSSPDSSKDYMNTIEPKSPGSATATPNYVWDGKDSGQFFVSQQAVKYGVKTFYSDAWSAPGFMKSNGDDKNGGTLSDSWSQAYANYLVQYISYYINAGIPITHLGFLNEPDLTTQYASMSSNGAQAAAFIKKLRPTLDSANYTGVQIVCCESTGWQQAQTIYSGLKSAGADSLIGIVSSHEYTSRASGSLSTTHKSWETEYADLSGAWTTAWYSNGGAGEGYTWANNIYTAIVNANVSAYIVWEGLQQGSTNEPIIQVNSAGTDYVVSKRVWAFAQWSRTVRPGAVRVGTSGGSSSFKTASFLNADGSVAVNVINSGAATTVSVGVAGLAKSNQTLSAVAWLTDSTNDFTKTAVTVASDGSLSAPITQRGMLSFVVTAA